jgi:hypothetical protein
MASADHYRKKAAEFAEMARGEADPDIKAEFVQLGAAYMRLADIADQKAMAGKSSS